MSVKTRGRGRIEAFPIGQPDPQTGDVTFAVSLPEAAVEQARLELDPLTGQWGVKLEDGREFTVPAAQAVVTWAEACEKTCRRVRPAEALVPSRHLPLEKPTSEAPVFTCVTCKSTYLRRVDAFICAHRDDDSAKPFDPPGDCESCGYPLGLHASNDADLATCTLTFAGGQLDVVPHDPRAKRRAWGPKRLSELEPASAQVPTAPPAEPSELLPVSPVPWVPETAAGPDDFGGSDFPDLPPLDP